MESRESRKMAQLTIREAIESDISRIVAIYNSNPVFLQHHLGKEQVETVFIRQEMLEMQKFGFCPGVIESGGQICGVMDFKADYQTDCRADGGEDARIDYRNAECVYLLLLMLDRDRQGSGLGSKCYAKFESMMKQQGRKRIRIDVVCDYPGNAVPFWEKQKFKKAERLSLTWGQKCSEAVVMYKEIGEKNPDTKS